MSGNPSDENSLLPFAESVHLRLPLENRQLPVLRAVATSIALREDFDWDAVADWKLIVEEVYAALCGVASPVSLLRCFFSDSPTELMVHAYVFAEPGATLEQQPTVGTHLLAALTDKMRVWHTSPADQALSQCHIEAVLCKQRDG